jgi:hypothetical protein
VAGVLSKDEFRRKAGLHELVLPSTGVSFVECAEKAFEILAQTRRFFTRGRLVVELVEDKEGNETLVPLKPAAFRSRLEEYFLLFAWRKHKEDWVLLPTRCSKDTAEGILETTAAFSLLPGIRLLSNCPIITERNGKLEILGRGYHDVHGGVFVLREGSVPEVPLTEAVQFLSELVQDFDFVTAGDKSRALASFIAPALRFGRILKCDFPLDVAEADESQSGKTYRQKLVCAVYGEAPYVITRRENGVGSLDESISAALISARPFIAFDNFRGKLDSQILESALRGLGRVTCRMPYHAEVEIDPDNVCWLLTSNQAEMTRDSANRSVVTCIRKREEGYSFKPYPTGDVLAHVQDNQLEYLGCVFSVIRFWHKAGKPRTKDHRHDFRESIQSLDWIVQNVFNLSPLLDGHREEQERISNPRLTWIRGVAVACQKAHRLDQWLKPSEIVDVCDAQDVDIGASPGTKDDQRNLAMGRNLSRALDGQDRIQVDGFLIEFEEKEEEDQTQRHMRTRRVYRFTRLEK